MATITTAENVTPSRSIAGFLLTAIGIVPGLLLCLAVTLAAWGLQIAEARLGHVWLESLMLAILLGTAVRSG